MMITSYFERRLLSSNPAPQTTVNGNSKRSSRNRVHPEGIDPVCESHNAIRFAASFVALPAGRSAVASMLTPSSFAAACTIGVLAALAVTYMDPAG